MSVAMKTEAANLSDAEIVGQVTAVAMKLSDATDAAPDGNARLPRRV